MKRTRQELSESVQCPHCSGSGIAEHPLKYGWTMCWSCSGSGLKKPPKFQAVCECGEKQPRFATPYTAQKWIFEHLRSHAPEEPHPDFDGVVV